MRRAWHWHWHCSRRWKSFTSSVDLDIRRNRITYEVLVRKLGFTNLEKLNSSGLMFDEIVGLQIPFFDEIGSPQQ